MSAHSVAWAVDHPVRLRRTGWATEGFCAALAIVSFANTLLNDFAYDDVAIVQNNPAVTQSGQWSAIWGTDYWAASAEAWPNRDLLYRPVTVSSFRLVMNVAGTDAWPQHLVNVLLHALAAALVVRVGRQMEMPPIAAGLAGAMFAVMPVHNEAVAAIVGRADLIVVIGTLAALLSHRRARQSESCQSASAWIAAAAMFSFLAMGAKESGIVVVPLLMMWDAVMARIDCTTRETRSAERWLSAATVVRLWYAVIPLGGYLLLRYLALDGRLLSQPRLTKTINVLVDTPPWQHALGAVQLFGMYWVKTFVPWVLSIGYSINSVRVVSAPWDFDVAVGAAAFVMLIVVAVRAWRRSAWPVMFAAAALLLSYAPTSNTFGLIQVFFAERLWYFPSVWAVLLLGSFLAGPWRFTTVKVLIALVLCAAVVRLWARNFEWRDNGTLYAAAVRDQPDAVQPMYLLSQWLVEHGRTEEGISLLQRVLQIDLGYTDAHRAMAQAYVQAGRVPEALGHLQTAQMQAPGHRPTEQALAATTRLVAAQANEELHALRRAAQANPEDLAATLALARRLREVGQVDESLRWLESSAGHFASRAEWRREHAVTLVMLNRVDDAIGHYQRAVELRSDDVQSKVELAMLLLERGREGDFGHADRLTLQAIEQSATAPAVLAARAEVLSALGRVREAIRTYREAIELLPPDSEQRRVYEQRARALGG